MLPLEKRVSLYSEFLDSVARATSHDYKPCLMMPRSRAAIRECYLCKDLQTGNLSVLDLAWEPSPPWAGCWTSWPPVPSALHFPWCYYRFLPKVFHSQEVNASCALWASCHTGTHCQDQYSGGFKPCSSTCGHLALVELKLLPTY